MAINILHVINEWPSGGIQEQVYLIIKHLPKNEFRHFVLGHRMVDGAFFKKYEEEGAINIISDSNYIDFYNIVKSNNIQIVHKQTGGGDFPNYVCCCCSNKVPIVESLHCPRASVLPVDKVETIIYTTDYTLNKNDLLHKNKMIPIQYSVDLYSSIVKEAELKDRDVLVVGRLGRIVWDKRPDVIINLAKKSYSVFGDKVLFKIAGYAPDKRCRDWFLLESSKLPNLEYVGFVENKYDFWRDLDVCVNPVWETSFDIVFLEAMACGIPILTWDNSAARYVVRDAGIVTEESIDSLFSGLEILMDPSVRKNLGQNGINRVNSTYSLSMFVRKYTDLYRSIIR